MKLCMASRHLTLGHALVAFHCPCLVSLCLSASFLCLCHFSVSLFLFLSSSVSSLACSLTLCRCVFFYLTISLTACSFLGVPDFLCFLSTWLSLRVLSLCPYSLSCPSLSPSMSISPSMSLSLSLSLSLPPFPSCWPQGQPALLAVMPLTAGISVLSHSTPSCGVVWPPSSLHLPCLGV